MSGLVYFSGKSENTARFIRKLYLPATRIPIDKCEAVIRVDGPFVLICPTYADCHGRGAVPKNVIRFLSEPLNRQMLRGVIGVGNRNFGTTFAIAADVISAKCDVPLLYKFELAGNAGDVVRVRRGLENFWVKQGGYHA